METSEPTSNPAARTRKQSKLLLTVIIPAASCMLSSLIGIFLGQIGNLMYSLLDQAAGCLAVPGFIVLFLISFGLSFLINKLLQRLLSGRKNDAIPE
ncbi:MAG: hypothetical protein JXA25_15185 [Anaerolineales bacterium]|nr:hypothetical protein [Anaerolineales bacterium]